MAMRWKNTLTEADVTPEATWLNRRQIIAGMGSAGLGLAGLGLGAGTAQAATLTPNSYDDITSYNNFYEFGSHKSIARAAQAMQTDPWSIEIDGLCAKPQKIGLEDLLKKMPVQERVYRHRCVEAWSMVVPWIGFPLADLVKLAEPTGEAKFVRFETLADRDTMPGLRQRWYPWPYSEGVTLEEALNPLPLMVVGAYGKVLHKQFGAPIRLHLTWKYGFKSLKSITRISFSKQRPVGFWEELQASEYWFWANVNPEVGHLRWSQASERVLGTDDRIPTQLFNGYGAEVAALYKDKQGFGKALWM